MLAELSNTIATLIGIFVALMGAFFFAFWVAMGIWTLNDIRSRTRDWLAIVLASLLVLVFPLVGLVLYMMIRPRETLADVFDRALEEESLLRELEGTLSCSRCGVPVQDNWNFCSNCHSQLRFACSSCGKAMRHEWSICVSCGADQHESEPSAVDGQSNSTNRGAASQASTSQEMADSDAAFRPTQETSQRR
jgi:hypothetical protein